MRLLRYIGELLCVSSGCSRKYIFRIKTSCFFFTHLTRTTGPRRCLRTDGRLSRSLLEHLEEVAKRLVRSSLIKSTVRPCQLAFLFFAVSQRCSR